MASPRKLLAIFGGQLIILLSSIYDQAALPWLVAGLAVALLAGGIRKPDEAGWIGAFFGAPLGFYGAVNTTRAIAYLAGGAFQIPVSVILLAAISGVVMMAGLGALLAWGLVKQCTGRTFR